MINSFFFDNESENLELICPSPINDQITSIPLFNNNPLDHSILSVNREMDDFDAFYNNNFMKEKNDANKPCIEYEETNLFINPKFEFQLGEEKNLVYSEVKESEDSFINVEIFEEKSKKEGKEEKLEKPEKQGKETIFEIVKDKRKKEKKKNKKIFKSNKKKKINNGINKDNKYFPFDKPKGILSLSQDGQNSVLNTDIQKDIFPFKFITKKYSDSGNGTKKLEKKKRKLKCDDINKKIKSRFHKTLKNIINQNLKKAGAQQLFYFIPQCFIEKVSKKFNLQYFNMTYKELLSKDFCTELNKNYFDINYDHNVKVLKYLEENEEISKNSGFDLIKNMTYETLLRKYFNSAQFEDSIYQLIDEKESPEYIYEYYIRATNYISYYLNPKNQNLMNQINNDTESI